MSNESSPSSSPKRIKITENIVWSPRKSILRSLLQGEAIAVEDNLPEEYFSLSQETLDFCMNELKMTFASQETLPDLESVSPRRDTPPPQAGPSFKRVSPPQSPVVKKELALAHLPIKDRALYSALQILECKTDYKIENFYTLTEFDENITFCDDLFHLNEECKSAHEALRVAVIDKNSETVESLRLHLMTIESLF